MLGFYNRELEIQKKNPTTVTGLLAQVRERLAAVDLRRGHASILQLGQLIARTRTEAVNDPEAPVLDRVFQNVMTRARTEVHRAMRAEHVNQGTLYKLANLQVHTELVTKVLEHIHEFPEGVPLSVEWVRGNIPQLFDAVQKGHGDWKGDWHMVQGILPPGIDFHVEAKYAKTVDEPGLEKMAERMALIAHKLGDSVVAQILISLGVVGDRDVPALRGIVSKHLGECEPQKAGFGFEDFVRLPHDVLRDPDVRRVIFIHLRDHVYREILEADPEGTTESQREHVRAILERAKANFNMWLLAHREMHEDLEKYWLHVIEQKSSERMVDKVADETGRKHPFPSLRQKIAMDHMTGLNPVARKYMMDGSEREKSDKPWKGRQLNATSMGGGKTADPFLAWDALKEAGEIKEGEQMIFLCPPGTAKQTLERVNKYYKEGSRPSVGLITSESVRNANDIEEACSKEIVLVAETMLGRERAYPQTKEEKAAGTPVRTLKVIDCLKFKKQSIVDSETGVILQDAEKRALAYGAVDEVHNARNPESKRAEYLMELFNGEDPIRYLQLMSGTPIPNRIADMITYLKLLDPENHAGVERVSAIDPLRLRNTLLKFLIKLELPENWRSEMEIQSYSLTEEERMHYDLVRSIRDIEMQKKMLYLLQLMLNPELHVREAKRNSMLDEAGQLAMRAFEEGKDTVLIAHPNLKDGFTQDAKDRGIETWEAKLKGIFGEDLIVQTIDGDTGEEDRIETLHRFKVPAGKKRVILANASTIREGINLTHIKEVIYLTPDFNEPWIHQFLRRFNRAGSKDTRFNMLVADETLSEIIYKLGRLKAQLSEVVQYGGSLTTDHLVKLEGIDEILSGTKVALGYKDQHAMIASLLPDELLVGAAYTFRFARQMHAAGEESLNKTLETKHEGIAARFMEDHPYSYHGNNARFGAGLIQALERAGHLNDKASRSYVDCYSGPMTLRAFLGEDSGCEVLSMDPNISLLDAGKQMHSELGHAVQDTDYVKGGCDQFEHMPGASKDLIHLNLSFNILKNVEKQNTLRHVNRALKDGGVMMITLPHYAGTPSERKHFVEELRYYGFEILSEFTGQVTAGKDSSYFENYTITARKVGTCTEDRSRKNLQLSLYSVKESQAKQRSNESLYEAHSDFTLGGQLITPSLKEGKEVLDLHRFKRLLKHLGDVLRAEPGHDFNAADIPAEFQDLRAYIIPMNVEKAWYLAVPRGKRFVSERIVPSKD